MFRIIKAKDAFHAWSGLHHNSSPVLYYATGEHVRLKDDSVNIQDYRFTSIERNSKWIQVEKLNKDAWAPLAHLEIDSEELHNVLKKEAQKNKAGGLTKEEADIRERRATLEQERPYSQTSDNAGANTTSGSDQSQSSELLGAGVTKTPRHVSEHSAEASKKARGHPTVPLLLTLEEARNNLRSVYASTAEEARIPVIPSLASSASTETSPQHAPQRTTKSSSGLSPAGRSRIRPIHLSPGPTAIHGGDGMLSARTDDYGRLKELWELASQAQARLEKQTTELQHHRAQLKDTVRENKATANKLKLLFDPILRNTPGKILSQTDVENLEIIAREFQDLQNKVTRLHDALATSEKNIVALTREKKHLSHIHSTLAQQHQGALAPRKGRSISAGAGSRAGVNSPRTDASTVDEYNSDADPIDDWLHEVDTNSFNRMGRISFLLPDEQETQNRLASLRIEQEHTADLERQLAAKMEAPAQEDSKPTTNMTYGHFGLALAAGAAAAIAAGYAKSNKKGQKYREKSVSQSSN